MSRVIKFRAWDKRVERMFLNDDFLNVGRAMMAISKIHLKNEEDMENGKGGLFLALDDPNMEFMQYTGLNDKNDAEIYEGDILTGSTGLHFVEYWEGEYWCNDGSGSGMPLSRYYRDYWVVGNIYENPGLLLKEQKEKAAQ